MASKLSVHEPEIFLQADTEINENEKNTLRDVTRKRRELLGWVIKGEMTGIHRGTNSFLKKVCCGAFLTVFWSPEVG